MPPKVWKSRQSVDFIEKNFCFQKLSNQYMRKHLIYSLTNMSEYQISVLERHMHGPGGGLPYKNNGGALPRF